MDIMSLALLLGSISGVLSVQTASAETNVKDNSRGINQILKDSCNGSESEEKTVHIQLLEGNVISVTCKNNEIAKAVVMALPGGSVELNLTKPC